MISDWMPYLAGLISEISPLKGCYTLDDMPGVVLDCPCGILITEDGTRNRSAGGPNLAVDNVRLTIYIAPQVLPEAMKTAKEMIEAVDRKIHANMSLGGLVSHVLPRPGTPFYQGPGSVDYGIGMAGGPKQYTSVIFNLEVKSHDAGFVVSA